MSNAVVNRIEQVDGSWSESLDQLLAKFSPARQEVWKLNRSHEKATVLVVRDHESLIVGALLEAGRQNTQYRKIVDFWISPNSNDVSDVLGQLLNEEIEFVQSHKLVALKIEERPETHEFETIELELLHALGFGRDADPIHSIESTRGIVRGWSKWLITRPQGDITYYGQTTDVSCGAGTALMAVESRGGVTLRSNDAGFNREIELDVWRSATNMPACEPVGLAVATAKRVTDLSANLQTPSVYLSTPGPSLLEWYSDFEYTLREQLQAESLRQAENLGIEVQRTWIPVEEIINNVRAGNLVYLLIDLTVMINEHTPHWVLAHQVIGDTVIISDPWVESISGETWVDCSNLPLSFDSLDAMTRWGEPAYRGVVIVAQK